MVFQSDSDNAIQEQENNPYTITEDVLQKRLETIHGGRYITQFYAAVTGNV